MLPLVERYGLLSDDRLRRVREKRDLIESWVARLESEKGQGGVYGDLLRRAEAGDKGMLPGEFSSLSRAIQDEVLYRVRYRGYLERDLRVIEKMKGFEDVRIPEVLDYEQVHGLRLESAQKLKSIRPVTLGQASRISGVSPADISILMVSLRG